MLVPLHLIVVVCDLNEPHSCLGEAASQQAHAAKVYRYRIVHPVELLCRRGFARQVFDLRDLRLHAKGEFE